MGWYVFEDSLNIAVLCFILGISTALVVGVLFLFITLAAWLEDFRD